MCDFTLIYAYYLSLNPLTRPCESDLWLHFSWFRCWAANGVNVTANAELYI